MKDVIVEDATATLRWQGRTDAVQFAVDIPEGTAAGARPGKVVVFRQGVPIGQIGFQITITAPGSSTEPPEPLADRAHLFQKAFISYATQDRSEALKRVQMLLLVGLPFFQDVLDLSPGDRWESVLYEKIDECDVFFLFWSTAAKNSKYVLAETRYAVSRKNGDDHAPPEIRPVILEGPPPPAPPADLEHLHFNDPLCYFMR